MSPNSVTPNAMLNVNEFAFRGVGTRVRFMVVRIHFLFLVRFGVQWVPCGLIGGDTVYFRKMGKCVA